MARVHVEFSPRDDGGSLARIERRDGVRLLLRSYDRTGDVQHDAVHLIGERALGMTGGLWGSLAAGALFDSVEIVGGRPRHDRHRRSAAVRRANAAQLRLAEVVVGVLQQCLDRDGPATKARLDEAWGITEVGPAPCTVGQAATAVQELRTLRERWRRPDGNVITYDWPEPRRR